MPMIDVYATAGTFTDGHRFAKDLAATLTAIEEVPDIPVFRRNTAAFSHESPAGGLSNVDGASHYVRVQVLTNAGALDRDKQIAVVSRFTGMVAAAAGARRSRIAPGCCRPRPCPVGGGWAVTRTPTTTNSSPRRAGRSGSCRRWPGTSDAGDGHACSWIQAFASVVHIAASPAFRARPRLCGPWANTCTVWGTWRAASAAARR